MPHRELNLDTYPIRFDLRVDWAEVDSYGHVNNLAIQRYIQSTRVHAMEEVGMMQHHKETAIGPVLVSVTCHFRKQLYYPGKVTVLARIDHLKTTSFQIHYVVLDEAGEVVALSQDVMVLFDFSREVKCAIPETFRRRFERLGATSQA
nr:acyl-CoA thioesterase [uncultured Holophaga sp.]